MFRPPRTPGPNRTCSGEGSRCCRTTRRWRNNRCRRRRRSCSRESDRVCRPVHSLRHRSPPLPLCPRSLLCRSFPPCPCRPRDRPLLSLRRARPRPCRHRDRPLLSLRRARPCPCCRRGRPFPWCRRAPPPPLFRRAQPFRWSLPRRPRRSCLLYRSCPRPRRPPLRCRCRLFRKSRRHRRHCRQKSSRRQRRKVQRPEGRGIGS